MSNLSCNKLGLIAIFLPSLAGGGAERAMVNLAHGLVERGFRVDLVLAKAKGPYMSEVRSEVKIVDLDASRVIFSLAKLVSYFRREKPYVMLSTLGHACIISLFAKYLSRESARIIFRESINVSYSLGNVSTIQRLLWKKLVRRFYPLANGIITPSQGVADDLIRSFGVPEDHIKVIYTAAINDELFTLAEKKTKHPWLEDRRFPVVLAVGRLSKQKDYATLLKAFSIVTKKRASRLIILGDGEERTRLQDLIVQLNLEDSVDMPGFVQNPFAYMAKSTVFVLSSIYEGLPNVLIQALALGVPVISTNCDSGPREILQDGRLGSLVPVGDAEALARSIIEKFDNVETHKPTLNWKNTFSNTFVIDEYINFLLLTK